MTMIQSIIIIIIVLLIIIIIIIIIIAVNPGAVFHYTLVSLTVWWFLHVAVFFSRVLFPFHAQQLRKDKKHKYIFTVVTIIG